MNKSHNPSSISGEINILLVERDYAALLDLCENDRRYWKALRLATYEADENIFWPAVEITARLMQKWWESVQEERVKEYIRTLLWSLNDESGGIGWNAPQIIAETIVKIPELIEPYASIMISRALDEPPLVKNGLWAIGRLGKQVKEVVEFFEDLIFENFKSSDPQTVGLAAWAMGEVGFDPAIPFLEPLKGREEPVRIYIKGDFQEKPLGYWAEEAIGKVAEKASAL